MKAKVNIKYFSLSVLTWFLISWTTITRRSFWPLPSQWSWVSTMFIYWAAWSYMKLTGTTGSWSTGVLLILYALGLFRLGYTNTVHGRLGLPQATSQPNIFKGKPAPVTLLRDTMLRDRDTGRKRREIKPSRWRDLNQRPLDCKACALSLHEKATMVQNC